MKIGPFTRAFLAALALLFHIGLAAAFDDTGLLAAEREAKGMRSDLERVQTVLDQEAVTDEQLAEQRGLVEKLRLDAVAEAEKLSAPLDDVNQQLNQLGPLPTGDQKEAATTAVQRSSLTDAVARFTAAKKQFELLGLEAEQMSSKVSGLQRTQFFQRIFKSDKSILNLQLWRDTYLGVGLFGSRITNIISLWWQNQAPDVVWTGLLYFPAIFLAFIAITRYFRFNLVSWLTAKNEDDGALSPLRRLWRVVWGSLVFTIIVFMLAILSMVTLDAANLLTPRILLLVRGVMETVAQTLVNTGLAFLICAPRKPSARLIAVDDRVARIIPLFVMAATFVKTLAAEATTLSDQLLLPVSLVAGQSALATAALILLAALMLIVLRRQAENPPINVPKPHYLTWFVTLMPFIWLLLAVSFFGLVFGYLALAYFVVGKILDTVLGLVLLVLIHHLVDAIADTLQNPASNLGQKLRRVTSMSEHGISRLSLGLKTLSDVVLVVLGIPWFLALWTVTWVDFRSLFNNAMVGFHIGNVNISPVNIGSLLVILMLGVLLTRFVTRWLDRRILTQTRLNKGVQDSVRTGANYMGYVFAAGFALSAAGFDFSNIAIIAGALGVGIGFGLQSIVNNFVSGLILLAERPIRVGDWVVTGDGEGIVKKINVRSTEIETFDNCTIIVPNSNLITSSVRNWTHHDTLGRFLVTVGVAPGSDTEIAATILTQVVNAHSKVLRFPAATIQLARFTNYSIEFELRGHVADIFEAAQVSSDLRFAVAKAFKEKGIIIPSISEPPVRT